MARRAAWPPSCFGIADMRTRLLASLLAIALAGCAVDDEGDELDDLAFDGKGDAPGLVDHDSSLQEIHEIGSTFTDTATR